MDLLLFTAPPAAGKTYWLQSFFQSLESSRDSLLIVSPLRALADECKEKWEGKITVVTPEEWSANKTFASHIVFDEFHLLFFWGDSFRPLMWEVFYELSSRAELVIGLTATLNHLEDVREMKAQFDQIVWCDHGNLKLKNNPTKYFYHSEPFTMKELLLLSKAPRETHLVFCAYREEVKVWKKRLEDQGYSVLACIGGEASRFREELKKFPHPDFIVATSVLSHGVNLPAISRVYFLYRLECPEFWIQMVARGGRRGERFEVHALEKPLGIKWNPLTNFLAILHLRLRIGANTFFRQWEEWFLKA